MTACSRRQFVALLGGMVPGRLAGQSGNGRALGNLAAPIEGYARTLHPKYSFLEPRFRDVENWKREAREVYNDRLAYNPGGRVEARVTARSTHNGYRREDLLLRTSPFTEAPAVLLLPQNPLPQRPAIVALHDHGGFYYYGKEKLIENAQENPALTEFKQRLYEGRSFACDLARAGYAVFVIDAFFFGGRKVDPASLPPGKSGPLKGLTEGSPEYVAAYNRLANGYEQLTAKTIFLSGATWPGMILWDDLRSVDYLSTRPEVNPERIGCAGLSFGGLRAAQLGGMHGKIRSTVVCCFMSTYARMLPNDVEHHTWMLYAPGTGDLLDLPDIASLTLPNALLVQYGRRDPLFSAEGKTESADKLRAVFAKARCPEKFRATFADVPHMMSKAMQDEALDWFGKTLR